MHSARKLQPLAIARRLPHGRKIREPTREEKAAIGETQTVAQRAEAADEGLTHRLDLESRGPDSRDSSSAN